MITKRGWQLPVKPTHQRSSENTISTPVAPSSKWPTQVSAALIDPSVLTTEIERGGVYLTISFNTHPFSESTLLNNCGAIHLVNKRELLVPGTFKKAHAQDYIDAGTQSIPISGRGTRVMKNALNGARGENTEDLTLTEVAVVEGFHVNIISEARLFKAGVWFSGIDCSLRYGEQGDNVVMKQLERRANLVFFEYKARSYFPVPPHIPQSVTLMFPTLTRTIGRAYRKTHDYAKPRADSEEK